MTDYKRRASISGLHPGQPPIGNVLARLPATRHSMHQPFPAQDRMWASGRRLVLAWGLNGASGLAFPETNPTGSPITNPTYPDPWTPYTIARAKRFYLTSGCHLQLELRALPSGETQIHDGSSGFKAGGAMGRVIVGVTWTNEDGATETRNYPIDLDGSKEQYGAQPDGAGEAWIWQLRRRVTMNPDGIWLDAALMAKWSTPGTFVDLNVKYVGNPRVVSAHIWERPLAIARDYTKDNWMFHGYGSGENDLNHYPHGFPVQKASDAAGGDPTQGTQHLVEVAVEQGKQLGPSLFYWTCWQEEKTTKYSGTPTKVSPQDLYDTSSHDTNNPNATGDKEAPPITGTDTSFVNILDTSFTSWNEDAPGFGLGSGGYGRSYPTSGKPFLRDKTGVVDAKVAAYITNASQDDTTTIRVMASPFSYVDLEVKPSGNDVWTWDEVVHHFQCGRTPEDGQRLQIFAKTTNVSGFGEWKIRYIHGQRMPELP
jgi:hypothetical protein